ncbi:MAG: hypothetical protein IT317_01010 [Anaerolineales bacterium]|nr:hypothetical protein [Anaerolineales bacterium]
MRLAQLLGLLRYEAIMYLRRRGWLVLWLAVPALPLLFALNVARQRLAAGAAGEVNAEALTRAAVYFTLGPVFVTQMILLPLLAADSLPRDRQLGVRELLDSLPLSTGVYLGGKLLGLWASLALGVALALGLTGLAWRLVGPMDFAPYLELWVVRLGGLIWINGSLGLLLGAGQPNRPRAVLLGAALVAVMLFTLAPGMLAAPGATARIWNPARAAMLTPWPFEAQSRRDVWQTLAVGAGQVALLALAMWAWLRRRRA